MWNDRKGYREEVVRWCVHGARRAAEAAPAATFLPLDIGRSSSPVTSHRAPQLTVQRNRGAGESPTQLTTSIEVFAPTTNG